MTGIKRQHLSSLLRHLSLNKEEQHELNYMNPFHKRTGRDTCFLILTFYGFQLHEAVTDPILTNLVEAIAKGTASLLSVQNWLKENTVEATSLKTWFVVGM